MPERTLQPDRHRWEKIASMLEGREVRYREIGVGKRVEKTSPHVGCEVVEAEVFREYVAAPWMLRLRLKVVDAEEVPSMRGDQFTAVMKVAVAKIYIEDTKDGGEVASMGVVGKWYIKYPAEWLNE